jgi:integrase
MNTSYLDIIDVKVKYWRQPRGDNSTIYYERRIANDLLDHYKPSTKITRSTGQNSLVRAIPVLFKINQSVESEWKFIREKKNRGENSANLTRDAFALLSDYDIDNKGKGEEVNTILFEDYLDSKLPYDAKQELHELGSSSNESDIRFDILKKYLDPHELVAIDIYKGNHSLYLSEYVQPYADLKGFKESSKQFKDTVRAVKQLTDMCADRPPHKYSRPEINDFIKSRLYSGVTTGTVERNFNVLNAMINKVNIEYEIDEPHRFAKPNIPRKGEDKKERKNFSADALATLRSELKGSTSDVDCLIKIMLDTGMRVGEVVGLASQDINLDCKTPYIALQKHPLRRLKTKNSERFIPLVGLALESVKRLDLGASWLFSRYLNKGETGFKSTSASNTANNRIRRLLQDANSPTCHSLRHTMQTRLRDVECPEDIRKEILGWRAGISERYGSPTKLKIKAEYMIKTLD